MKNKILATIIVLVIFSISILIYFVTNLIQDEISKVDTIEPISTYNNPVIPKGFKKVETEDASWKLENGIPKGWNDGLVIEDEIGNQFVWVPSVEILNEDLLKIYDYSIQSMQEIEQRDIQLKMHKEQTEKYGGFYVARYEAGITDEMQRNITNISSKSNDILGKPVSKEGQIVWNYISLKNAKNNAQSMYNSDNVESDLISPIQWLTIMQWLYNCNYDISDAKEWGNFSNVNFRFTGWYSTDYGKVYDYGESKLKVKYNMILSTGATERNKSNNIYDLAGNVMEYTDGWVKDRGYYSIGGHYDDTGSYGIYIPRLLGVEALGKLGYRIVLYLK